VHDVIKPGGRGHGDRRRSGREGHAAVPRCGGEQVLRPSVRPVRTEKSSVFFRTNEWVWSHLLGFCVTGPEQDFASVDLGWRKKRLCSCVLPLPATPANSKITLKKLILKKPILKS
jgi:hypothetical protein